MINNDIYTYKGYYSNEKKLNIRIIAVEIMDTVPALAISQRVKCEKIIKLGGNTYFGETFVEIRNKFFMTKIFLDFCTGKWTITINKMIFDFLKP